MIIVNAIGGLGNQMFQIAAARVISLKTGEKILIDRSAYKTYKIREFSSHNLNITDEVLYETDFRIPWNKKVYNNFSRILFRIYRKGLNLINGKHDLTEKNFLKWAKYGLYYNFDRYYYDIPISKRNFKYMYGYFQSSKYYKGYESIIKKEMKVKTPPSTQERTLIKEIINTESVGVSIRIGDDYLNNKDLNVFSEDYYYKGMDYIYNKKNNVVFYIFSDCPEEVKQRFKFKYPVVFINGFRDYESLRLLYSCKHFILSNSSFSWWGSYLSDNENKIVVAPNKWYNTSIKRPDIYEDDMIIIK